MSQQNYAITYYGIPIPIDNSELYQHVLKNLFQNIVNFIKNVKKMN